MKKLLPTFVFILLPLLMTAQTQTPEQTVQANLDAYNAHDIEAFMSYFADDIEMYNFNDGKQTANGIEEVRAIYGPYFKTSPELHSKILKRTVFDNKVMDHEYITGARGGEPFEIVLIYEVENDKIIKMTAIRKL